MLKRLFILILILSVFTLGQNSLWGNFRLKSFNEAAKTSEHFHEHGLLSEMRFFVLGFLTHTHEHTHDKTDAHDTTDSKAHSHAATSQLKTEFVASQNCLFFSNSSKSIFGKPILNLHSYDHPFQIFRPPIYI